VRTAELLESGGGCISAASARRQADPGSQKRADVVSDLSDLQFKVRVSVNVEGLATLNGLPFGAAGWSPKQCTGLNFHQFGAPGIEFVFSGQHDSESFCAAIRKLNGPTGDSTVEIDVGSLDDCDPCKPAHSSFPANSSKAFRIPSAALGFPAEVGVLEINDLPIFLKPAITQKPDFGGRGEFSGVVSAVS
jgi:hypothetical protein